MLEGLQPLLDQLVALIHAGLDVLVVRPVPELLSGVAEAHVHAFAGLLHHLGQILIRLAVGTGRAQPSGDKLQHVVRHRLVIEQGLRGDRLWRIQLELLTLGGLIVLAVDLQRELQRLLDQHLGPLRGLVQGDLIPLVRRFRLCLLRRFGSNAHSLGLGCAHAIDLHHHSPAILVDRLSARLTTS